MSDFVLSLQHTPIQVRQVNLHRYIVKVRVVGNKKRSYKITGEDTNEVKEKLLTRLHPDHRESVIIDSIEIDPETIRADDPFGTFFTGDEKTI